MSISKRAHSASPPTSSPTSKRTRQTTPVRFLILSDTHSAELPSPLPACDVVLHCGDLTSNGTPSSISGALRSLGQIPAELKLAIAGNHDISLDRAYYTSEGGSTADVDLAQALVSPTPESEATRNNVTFLEEGTHTFTLSSGTRFTIYTSPYTPAHGASAFQYPTDTDRFNPAAATPSWARNVATATSTIPERVDILMTHGPAKYILDTARDGQSAGCEHLRRAVARVRPRLFCFGHVHGGYGAQRFCFAGENKSHERERLNRGGGDADAETDAILPQPQEWVGRNQARRKGYATLGPGSMEAFRRGRETLAVNAALQGELSDEEEEAERALVNMPWVVELEL
ncbi:hydrolase [Ascochyta rabiei]|uniref:Hydrolase n=2 Tax=Didymella rabiei TaxID=5454 RepID=A0A162ZBA3_DIDRA|nr:hydrolase [Ascochyta rabiei]